MRRYDWKNWFSRERFTLLQGRDYSCSTSSMIQCVRNHASKIESPIRIVEIEGGFTVLQCQVDGRRYNVGAKRDA